MPGWIRRWQIKSVTEPVLTDAQRPEQTLVSKWFVQASEPVRVRPPLNHYPALFLDPVPRGTVTLDDWFARAPDRVDGKRRAADYPAAFFDPKPVAAIVYDPSEMGWWRPAPDHLNKAPRTADYPFLAYNPQPFGTVQFDMWWRQAEEPARRFHAMPEHYQFLAFDFQPVPAVVSETGTATAAAMGIWPTLVR